MVRRAWRRLAVAIGAAGALALQAEATTLIEGTSDFGDSFAARTLLPDGTDVVRGGVHPDPPIPPSPVGFPDYDYFAFTDLVPGGAFRITLRTGAADGVGLYSVLDESEALLFGGYAANDQEISFDGTTPLSGQLVVFARAGQDTAGYQVTLVADRVVVPEPSTALLTGAGLAAGSYLRRRRAREQPRSSLDRNAKPCCSARRIRRWRACAAPRRRRARLPGSPA